MKDGGPAFPQPIFLAGNDNTINVTSAQNGMSLRDYFAAKNIAAALIAIGSRRWWQIVIRFNISENVRVAYEIADAMIAERDK